MCTHTHTHNMFHVPMYRFSEDVETEQYINLCSQEAISMCFVLQSNIQVFSDITYGDGTSLVVKI